MPAGRFPWPEIAIVSATFVIMAWWTWGTWLDPVVDFGRELYVPWRLSEGDSLFRDVAWFNGPLSQYWNAALFHVFGVGLRTLALANMVWIGLVTVVVFRLVASVSDRFAATIGCVVFLVMFAFGRSEEVANFNWVCPYSHEMTHGVGLSLVALLVLVGWLRKGGAWRLAVVGSLLGLVFLTKPEVFLALVAALALALVLGWAKRREAVVREGALLVVGATVPVLVAFVSLWMALPAGEAWHGVLGAWPHVVDSRLRGLLYYEATLGTDEGLGRVGTMFLTFGAWGLAALPILLARRLSARSLWAAVAIAVTILIGGLMLLDDWSVAFSALPVALIVIAIFAWRARCHEVLVISAFAGTALLKTLLNVRVSHYGFALSAAGILLVVSALLAWLPRRLARDDRERASMRLAALGVVALVVGAHVRIASGFLREYSKSVASGVDAFRSSQRGFVVATFGELLATMPEDTTVVALPEGVLVNYLARRRNPTGFVNFMPPELIMFGEDRILASLQETPPDFIVLTGRLTVEYGLPLFGTHYGQKIKAWVDANYREHHPRTNYGPKPLVPERIADNRFSVWLLERRR